MRRTLIFVILFGLLCSIIIGQKTNLYIPLNIKKAVDNRTRTLNGLPGTNYWQNKSEYKIDVNLLPDSSYLIGYESINYHNNSPDSIDQIVIRLYQDIAKNGAVRDWFVGTKNFGDGVKINYLVIENDTIDISRNNTSVRRSSTNLFLTLKEKLEPNSNLQLKIGWEFAIPKNFKIRMGNYGNGNYYIAYWYPQIAVYDDIDGWDKVEYSGMVEFYNDFSDYDVSISLPKGYVAWATGELQNGAQVLREDIYKKYLLAQKSDTTVRIIDQTDYKKGLITAENDINKWHFVAKNVTDFSFATSKNYNWDGASIIVDKKTGRRALTDAVYPDSTVHYDKAAQFARETIEDLSYQFPGYPYSYSHATSYCNGNRGGGMESPMMANDGAPTSRASHIGLIFHEIAHNYFPFIMGTNERKYAWMDEGWAAFLPTEMVNKYEPEFDYRKRRVQSYSNAAGTEADLPLLTPSYSYKTRAMRLGFYDRPACAYYALNELLGDELFKKSMLEYITRWNGKHPIPIDFFLTINNVLDEDLSWFWKPWFYEFGYPDLAIVNAESTGDMELITISKEGNIPTRVKLTVEYKDGTTKVFNKSSRVWSNGDSEIIINIEKTEKINKIMLGDKYIPDSVPENNVYYYK